MANFVMRYGSMCRSSLSATCHCAELNLKNLRKVLRSVWLLTIRHCVGFALALGATVEDFVMRCGPLHQISSPVTSHCTEFGSNQGGRREGDRAQDFVLLYCHTAGFDSARDKQVTFKE